MAEHEPDDADMFNADGDDVNLWLQRWDISKALNCWTDIEAINHAVLSLGHGPFRFYLRQAQAIVGWDDFVHVMRSRYADDEQTLMMKLQNRFQQENESVEAFSEAQKALFLQIGYPESAQRDISLRHLKPSLRTRVINTCPSNLSDAVRKAMFLEAQDSAQSSQKIQELLRQVLAASHKENGADWWNLLMT